MINRFIPFPLSLLGHCRRRLATCVIVGLIPLLSIGSARAVAVDSELLLLVDVSKGLSDSDFDLMTQSIANSFKSPSVLSILNSIESGHSKSVAVSLVFWAGINKQQTAVPWVNITDSTSAAAFAQSVENAVRPWSTNGASKTALGDAISNTTTYFGDETGGTSNGFESSVQIVNIIGGREDNNTPTGNNYPAAVAAARDLSLASGADIINAIAITNEDTNNIASYYDNFVVGGNIGPIVGSTTTATNYSTLQASFTPFIASTLSQAAVSTVPEPATTLTLLVACSFIFIRRR